MTTCPVAAGEEWGQRWNFNPLVECHNIDYIRATLPNVGGITEMMKVRDARDRQCSPLYRPRIYRSPGELPRTIPGSRAL
jgi:L-alanine-DL-glutamate epimerase-like enolase superfamily enzyme